MDRGGNGRNGDGTWPATDGCGCPVCGQIGGGGHGGGCPNMGRRFTPNGDDADVTWEYTLSCGDTYQIRGHKPMAGGYVTCSRTLAHQTSYRIVSVREVTR